MDSTVGLSPENPTLPSLLKKAGYETYLVGKWHMGFSLKFSPIKHGFDEFFGFNGGGIDYISHTDPYGNNDLYENETLVTRDGYMTDLLSQRAEDIIRRKHDKPFFLCVTFNAPHWPWQVPGDAAYPHGFQSWQQNGNPSKYAGMVKSMDSAIGRIVKLVDDMGLANNTVVIFTSDNGGERFSDQGIYKGSKMMLWEGGIREPAIVRWPGKIKENSTSLQVVTTFDWTATILGLAKAKADPKFPLDGIDVSEILAEKKPEVKRTLYWRISQRRNHKAMRDGVWKWIRDEKNEEYLFDVSRDPSEKEDLKTKYPEIFERLKKKYEAWEASMLKPLGPV